MKIFISAGEPSGDIHSAALIESMQKLQPNIEFVGFGGTEMRNSGCKLLADMSTLAIMGVSQVFPNYLKFKRLLKEAKALLQQEHFDAVILVDYPGFNWHLAKAAKELGITTYYFMPPQIWSWARWRIKKMKRYIDTILAPLPFEHRWFLKHGCSSIYIGHPFFEEVRKKTSDSNFLQNFYAKFGGGPIVTILPGSRNQEVKNNLDDMLLTIEYVRSKIPSIQPVIAAYNTIHAEYIQERLSELDLSIPVFVGKTNELIRAADCALAVSGSVSLELLACNKPTVIYYRVQPFPLLVQRCFRRTRS
ncbi:MAG: lipid-A-disaccharide synthase, partial [Thermoguttaceae bacterium]